MAAPRLEGADRAPVPVLNMRKRDRYCPVFTDGTPEVLVAQTAEALKPLGLHPVSLVVGRVHTGSPPSASLRSVACNVQLRRVAEQLGAERPAKPVRSSGLFGSPLTAPPSMSGSLPR